MEAFGVLFERREEEFVFLCGLCLRVVGELESNMGVQVSNCMP